MNDGWLERSVNLKNKQSLHMRPAQKVVEAATSFESEIHVLKDHLDLNAKSILDMIEFAAHMVNTAAEEDNVFIFRAKGPDAPAALQALAALVNNHFDQN